MADQKKVNFYALADANNQLAVKLHKLLAGSHENVFFSPLCISTALAMLFHGTGGKCSEEMRKVLGYNSTNIADSQVAICFSNFYNDYTLNTQFYKLSTANLVLVSKKALLKDRYKIDLKIFYRALVKEVDFLKDSQKIKNEVNDYVYENTNRAFSKIVDYLDPETLLIILNAIYFKGTWLYQFEKHWTYPQMFYNNGKEDNAKEIPMMHIKQHFQFLQKESFKALKLPYKGSNLFMLILLPRSKTGLQELESKLTNNFLIEMERDMFNLRVDVSLPKFVLKSSKYLKDVLQKIGLNRIFNTGADFSGISDSNQLSVSDIFHKAVLEVNEDGSETAPLTAISQGSFILDTPEFNVDHPFLFLILDTKKNLILFMGRVEEI